MQTWSKGSTVFRPNVRLGKRCYPSDFDCGMIVGARQGGLSISETAARLGFSCTPVWREWYKKRKPSSERQFRRQRSLVNERGQWARLVKAERKVTVMQIITYYNSGMQKSIRKHKTSNLFKWTVYGSRRPIKRSPINTK